MKTAGGQDRQAVRHNEEVQPSEAAHGEAEGETKAKPKAKAKAKGKAKAKAQAKTAAQPARVVASPARAAPRGAGEPIELKGKPFVQRGLMRSLTAYTGPAKGWQLYAYLAERKGLQKQVKWRAVSPSRTRAFDSFKPLQEAVGEGVYTHLHQCLRPQLLRKIRQRRTTLEISRPVPATPAPLAIMPGTPGPVPIAAPPPPKRAKRVRALEDAQAPQLSGAAAQAFQTPKRPQKAKRTLESLPAPSLATMATQAFPTAQPSNRSQASIANAVFASQSALATQAFDHAPVEEVGRAYETWPADCEARLRRHPRCPPPGQLQPPVVHIKSGNFVVGRLQSCDVVLDSTSTPQMISRRHALLTVDTNVCKLVDQGAMNGVLVNGDRVQTERALAHGDVVTFGVATMCPELDYIFEKRPEIA